MSCGLDGDVDKVQIQEDEVQVRYWVRQAAGPKGGTNRTRTGGGRGGNFVSEPPVEAPGPGECPG